MDLALVLEHARNQFELADAMRRVTRHEFRTPVTVIRSFGPDGRTVSYDISEIGMGLIAPFTCEIGEQVILRLTIKNHGLMEQSALITRVVELTRGIWELGCMFRRWDDNGKPATPSIDEKSREWWNNGM